MLSNLSFDRSRFALNKPHTLPLVIPMGCKNAVIFSLKTEKVFDDEVFLWSPKKAEFMLNVLFLWNDICHVFELAKKSQIFNSKFSEVYSLTIENSFAQKFDTRIEAIVYARLLLELVVEKANKISVSQMNYLTTHEYLEKIEICELLLID